MEMTPELGGMLAELLLWSLIATAALTTILQGSQGLGLSRLSVPFLLGTMFTGNRHRAMVIGSIVYTVGGWWFAIIYYLIFASLGWATWWLGAAIGALHATVLLVAGLPLLPHFHPRMASEYHGPTETRRLEPPGFMGMNYGRQTPVATILGHALYGGILGAWLGG